MALCSLMAGHMVWTQPAITSPSHTVASSWALPGSSLARSFSLCKCPTCQPIWTLCHFPHTASSCCPLCPDSPPSFPDDLSSSHTCLTVAIVSSFKVYIQLSSPLGKMNFPPEWSHSTLFTPPLLHWLPSSVLSARVLGPFASLLLLHSLPKWSHPAIWY